jgi:hypothetical protein
MRRILSITRRGIAAVRIAFGQPDTPAELLPPLRMITHLPEPVSESRSDQNRSVRELPPAPTPNQDKASDDDLELRRICEAIGLDVKDVTGKVTGEATPRAAIPVTSHHLSVDLGSNGLNNHDLSNDVSDDVLRLIEHVEATNARKPGLRPSAGDVFEPPTPPGRQTRAKSPSPAHRESAQTPFVRATDLADVLASLKLRLLKIRLAPDDMDEAQAEISTAVAQLRSPRPKPQIIALSLNTLVSILETAGPAALTKDVETSLTRLRAFLLQLNA